MKKILLFPIIAMAMIYCSFAMNFCLQNRTKSDFGRFLQTANATTYYTQGSTNPFIAAGNFDCDKAVWYKVKNQDVPCDYSANLCTVCMFGGGKTCPKGTNPGDWYVGSDVNVDTKNIYYYEIGRGVDEEGDSWVWF